MKESSPSWPIRLRNCLRSYHQHDGLECVVKQVLVEMEMEIRMEVKIYKTPMLGIPDSVILAVCLQQDFSKTNKPYWYGIEVIHPYSNETAG